jgi:hypothetical protein
MYLLVIQSNAEQVNKENIEKFEGKATYLSKGIVFYTSCVSFFLFLKTAFYISFQDRYIYFSDPRVKIFGLKMFTTYERAV